MAELRMIVSVRTTPVVRDSDGQTVLLVEARCGESDRPILLQVVDPPDREE